LCEVQNQWFSKESTNTDNNLFQGISRTKTIY
jgi:hypothetical protein